MEDYGAQTGHPSAAGLECEYERTGRPAEVLGRCGSHAALSLILLPTRVDGVGEAEHATR
jgi:hypothetical protein